MQRNLVAIAAIAGTLSAGCTLETTPVRVVETHAVVSDVVVLEDPPELVAIAPDVYVVEDSAYVTYFVDDAYWCYREGLWYRADFWDAPWSATITSFTS